MSNTVTVQIAADVRRMASGIQQTNQQLGGLNDRVSKVTSVVKGMVAGFAALGAVNVLGDTVRAASDLQQSIGAVGSVFGDYADTITNKSKEAAAAYGLSANEYNTSAALIGAVLKGQGVAADQLAGQVDNLVSRGTDLAATFGGTTAEAVDALGAAFKGEFDSLERYGISLKASDINAELAARGQDKLTGAALKLATQQATTDLIMRQSADAQGQFGRESNSLAVRQQQLAAKFENVKATIGNALLPVVSSFVGFLSDRVIPAAKEVARWFGENVVPALKDLGQWVQNNSTWLGALAAVIGTVALGLAAYSLAMSTWAAITRVMTAVQLAFNAVMAINPFVLIIIGLMALVAALVWAWNNSETFRNVVMAVWDAIKKAVGAVLDWFTNTLWPGIQAVWNAITSSLGAVKDFFVNAWNSMVSFISSIPSKITNFFSSIGGWFANLWNTIKQGAINGWNAMIGWIKGVPGLILSALGNLGSLLLDVGADLLRGLWNGIKNLAGWLKDKIIGFFKNLIPGWVKDVFGIHSPSRMFMEFGQFLTEGLAIGITDRRYMNMVKRSTQELGDMVSGAYTDPALGVGFSGGGGGAGGVQVVINAGLGTDPAQLERAVVNALKSYSGKSGSGWITRL